MCFCYQGLLTVANKMSPDDDENRRNGITADKVRKFGGMEIPCWSAIGDMRTGREGYNNAYETMFHVFMPHVVGVFQWNDSMSRDGKLEEIVSVTDEAFCLLVLENNWDRWFDMYNELNTRRDAKYTLQKRKRGCKFTSGWTKEGLKRYKRLHQLVTADRENDKRLKTASFDSQFMSRHHEKNCERIKRAREMESMREVLEDDEDLDLPDDF